MDAYVIYLALSHMWPARLGLFREFQECVNDVAQRYEQHAAVLQSFSTEDEHRLAAQRRTGNCICHTPRLHIKPLGQRVR